MPVPQGHGIRKESKQMHWTIKNGILDLGLAPTD